MTSKESHPRPPVANGGLGSPDSVIERYRWALVASHVVVLLYFLSTNELAILTRDFEPICWPYFQKCWQFRFDTSASISVLMLVQASLIIAAGYAVATRYYRTFWVVMVLLNLYVFAIISLDYRLRGNQFYMLFWLSAVCLFWPAKRWGIPLILISFYFWAGTLKLNYEWLSGSVLYRNLFIIPPRFAWLACGYVVALEMVMIWGLLAKRAWIRWLVLGQLALFHIESLSQIHWFYPLIMAALISWFVIDWTTLESERTVTLGSLFRGCAPWPAYVLLALFASFQLAPYLYHGDKALTGQGRVFALDMLEARQSCDVHAVVHYQDRTSEHVDLLLRGLPPRKICDPIIYYNRISNLCRSYVADPAFVDADFVMHVKRRTDADLSTIVDEANFCGRHEVYKMFSNNRWIK